MNREGARPYHVCAVLPRPGLEGALSPMESATLWGVGLR
jgi:hypothetical protein